MRTDGRTDRQTDGQGDTLVKVMTHPWVIDNNCVKYPDRTRVKKQTDGQTDRRTDKQGDSYIPQLCLRGGGG